VSEQRTTASNSEDEQLELYVLGVLSDDEAAGVERLMNVDPAVRERVRELRGVVARVPASLEPMQPSADLRERILTAARAESTDSIAGREPEASGPRQIHPSRRWLPWAIAAVLAIALGGSIVWNARLQDRLDDRPDVAVHVVTGSGPAAGTRGQVVVFEDTGGALLSLSALPPLEPGQVYQVWLIDGGSPTPSVTFVPAADGIASVAVPGDVPSFATLAVTVEPTGGSAAPTSDPIIVSSLS
jgi:anti-sigma-K factor RskA